MDSQMEKVYVALGNDLQDDFKTLDWALRKWKPKPFSIVILHFTSNISKTLVDTPFGKLPASAVSEEKLEVLSRYEQGKVDRLLSKYIAFCGKVNCEIQKVERADEPIHKVIVDLILRHKITKLVMGITRKSKNAISGSFYIHQHKANFCELFIISGGKLVILGGEHSGAFMEDDHGVIIAKNANCKNWLGKMFTEYHHSSLGRHTRHSSASTKSLDLTNSQNQWEHYGKEIESYFEHLMSLNLDEEIVGDENGCLQTVAMEAEGAENADSSMSVAENMKYRGRKMDEAQKIIRLKKEEAKANSERGAKAEQAICLCNGRVKELEAKIKEEVTNRIELTKNLEIEKEQIQEIISDIDESKNRLSSLGDLQSELNNKLRMSTLARTHVEAQLEKAVVARAEMVREIEELRRQRDVLQRRIEFCREKDAIGMVTKFSELSYGYREYTAQDIRSATDDFSESQRLKSGVDCTNVYRGRINHSMVAIKRLSSDD